MACTPPDTLQMLCTAMFIDAADYAVAHTDESPVNG